MLVDSNEMLYPQYSIERDVREAMNRWLPWAAGEARKLLAARSEHTSPNVLKHWKALAAAVPAKEE